MIVSVTLNASLDKTYSVSEFAVGHDIVAEQAVASPGGKGLNVASFTHLLGAQAVATGIVAGHTGRHILELLASRDIPADFVTVSGESRSCHIFYDPRARTLTQVREPGPTVDDAARRAIVVKVRELAEKNRIVVLSGSVPPGLGDDVYRELVAVAKQAGARVVLDAAGQPLALGLEAGPYMIKPNQAELAQLAQQLGLSSAGPKGPMSTSVYEGTCTSPLDPPSDENNVRQWAAEIGGRLHERFGIPLVVASLGPLGAVVVADGHVFSAVPPAITPINTVSCGDALVAGIVVGWQRGLPLGESVRLGIAASAAKALQFNTGYFELSDVHRLLPDVQWVPWGDWHNN